jgi:hypothetical protein
METVTVFPGFGVVPHDRLNAAVLAPATPSLNCTSTTVLLEGAIEVTKGA